MKKGSPEYWNLIAREGVPVEDWGTFTCEGDSGHGPCGRYTDWAEGRCAAGHAILDRVAESEGDDL
jgi:hypothetical protein